MLFVALFLRVWLVQILQAGLAPRALADDLLITAHGHDALPRLAQTFQDSLEHLIDIGGKNASSKSTLFSNNADVRSWLQRKRWELVNSTMPVVCNLRGLGASLAVGSSASTKLSKARLQHATHTLYRVFALPHNIPVRNPRLTNRP